MIVRKSALARDRFDDRNAPLDGEFTHDVLGKRIAHAAAGDQDRLLRGLKKRDGFREFLPVWAWSRHSPCPRLEENLRIVERQLLNVLRQGEESWTAIGGIE